MHELMDHPSLIASPALRLRGVPVRGARTSNEILDGLPPDQEDRLRDGLSLVTLAAGQVLCAPDEPQEHAYFPLAGFASLHYGAVAGPLPALALVGNEGVLGLGLFLGVPSPLGAVVAVPGKALRLAASAVDRERLCCSLLYRRVLRHAMALTTQMAQLGTCHRRHLIVQQVARWLLLVFDRQPGTVRLTHEQLAHWLDVRREGVTQAMGQLRQLGAIGMTRGQVWLASRERLEQAACDCYRVVRDDCERMLSVDAPR
jgi:CRP-like cAMP-binding protein